MYGDEYVCAVCGLLSGVDAEDDSYRYVGGTFLLWESRVRVRVYVHTSGGGL